MNPEKRSVMRTKNLDQRVEMRVSNDIAMAMITVDKLGCAQPCSGSEFCSAVGL